MSKLRTKVFFATGLPKEYGWSRAWERSTPLGIMQIALALGGPNARAQGGSFRFELQEAEPETMEGLYQVLHEVIVKAESAHLTSSLVVLVTVGSVMTLFAYRGAVVLERAGKRRLLLAPSQQLLVREGSFQSGDLFLLSTNEAWQIIKPLLEKIMLLQEPDQFFQQAQTLLRNQPDSSASAVVGAQVTSESLEPSSSSAVEPVGEAQAEQSPLSYSVARTSEGGVGAKRGWRWGWFLSLGKSLVRGLRQLLSFIVHFLKRGIVIGWGWLKRGGLGVVVLAQTVFRPQQTRVGIHIPPKKLLFLAGAIVTILIVTTLVTVRYRRQAQFAAQIAHQLAPFETRLGDLERQAELDPLQSREALMQLLGELAELEKGFAPDQPGYEQIAQFTTSAQQLLARFASTQALGDLSIFKDARTLSPSFLATDLTGNGQRAFLLDDQQQFVLNLNLSDRVGTETILPAEVEARQLAVQTNQLFLLGNGIFQLDTTSEVAEPREVLAADEVTAKSTLLAGFANYLYLLNPSQRAIYRYTQTSGGLVNRQIWIGAASGVPFDKVTSLVVDGSVWLGTNEGKVIRLQSGAIAPFELETLAQGLSSPLYLATTEESEALYILEPASKRILSIDKATGNVLSQVENSSLGTATGLVLDQANNQLLALSGSLLFAVPMPVNY